MGGGTSGLFPATKGAKPHQMSLTPDPVSVYHRRPTYAIGRGGDVGAEIGGAAGESVRIAIRNRTLLLTPSDVLRKCLHWRIGAVSEGTLVCWMQGKLNNSRYHMVPLQLRFALIEYVSKLKAARSVGKGYDIATFHTLIVQLEKELESMK